MKPLLALVLLLLLTLPLRAFDAAQCSKLHARQTDAFKSAVLRAAATIDKKSRCLSTREAIAIVIAQGRK